MSNAQIISNLANPTIDEVFIDKEPILTQEIKSRQGLLRVGTTGRRHIAPKATREIYQTTRAFFEILSETNVEVEFLSGLAIGADSIAARFAIAARDAAPIGRFTVVGALPTPRKEYAADFSRDAAPGEISERRAFEALLDRCDAIRTVPNPNGVSHYETYALLGDYLCENVDVLLAYWSGDASKIKPGGTTDVVLKKLARRKFGEDPLVYCVYTPELFREKDDAGREIYRSEPIDDAGKVAILRDVPTSPIQFVERDDANKEFRKALT